ncbi:MAG TPA: integrase arm-type DNA-binding domain-containing protein [Paraburkholderia sp.]|uniref:tyrosine-type recombinase/integrase n=1 Tax=Paraburkholderia sp. TaxID=1926495 RepID=UPI002B479CF9|nr:integrase arm-type DNA-binding domain-containing protein [Paraburkholderia sp.]HKR44059.1 integrase arm-type DNA-binding domain-containing protein [Paraburkholderia sp.]
MLTDQAIRSAKPAESPYKMADGNGLTLLIKPNGSKLWRFRYRFDGLEKTLALGTYPDTSVKLARHKRDEARQLLAKGVDPSERRQAEKVADANTFESVAREWLTIQEKKLAAATYAKAVWTLETLIFPFIGNRPINEIKAADVLKLLQRIENRGLHETAHRARQRCGQVFRYGVVTERCEHDITADLRGALAPVVTAHHASVTEPEKIGQLLRDIESYRGNSVTWYALRLAAHMFVRPGELRHAEWSEFDLEGKEPCWRIPASKMKMREAHIVPLSRQVVAWLKELHGLTGKGSLVFPSLHSTQRPISENTVNMALRRMGYDNETMTGHGFRSMASTSLNEHGWHPDVIELQLAHAERNKVRSAYNRAQRLPERRAMMQHWSDYLDELRAKSDLPR